jgi:tRNA modification GTPase
MARTIFALATASGRAAVAILRISGPAAGLVAQSLCGAPLTPRKASLRRITDKAGHVIDEALALWFPGPESYTGEDVLELQLHGGVAVVEAASAALLDLGLDPAEPGEFTRRAFEAGRLDLSQAEAVADLVDAETEAQRKQALSQLGGRLARDGGRWRDALIEALALLEAQIDFPDEDIPVAVRAGARRAVEALWREWAAAAADQRGERVRSGVKIALVGAPNAGKSSLLNTLVGRDAAIVSRRPGTTRDVIEVAMVLSGAQAVLADMAGLRETEDEIEAEGVRRARTWAEAADLRLLVKARDAPERMSGFEDLARPGDLRVTTKVDLEGAGGWGTAGDLETALNRPETLEALRRRLEASVRSLTGFGESLTVTRARHRDALGEGAAHLERALERIGSEPELAAEDVRLAARCLERISGRIGGEAVLDRVFASFCIGK